MKILVPTDLSPLSKVAVLYAAELCVALKAKLIEMNVLYIDQVTQSMAGFTTDDLIQARIKEREAECIELVEDIKSQVEGNLKAEVSVENGGPLEETINTFALRHQCDLIVMGTKGASGVKKAILGSNASAVVNNSSIPVLTVPEFAVYKGMSKLVYATDMKNISEEFKLLMPFVNVFNPVVHVLHVYNNERPKTDEKIMCEQLKNALNYFNIECHYIAAEDVKSGIENYLKENKTVDVLAMFSGKRNFLERMFEKSNSREMILQNTVPLLTFSK